MRTPKLLQQLHSLINDLIYKSGRIHSAVSLAPLTFKSQQTAAGILSDISAGNFFLCARIRSGDEIAESVETTNLQRIPIRVIQ